jgi:hypothetical protein
MLFSSRRTRLAAMALVRCAFEGFYPSVVGLLIQINKGNSPDAGRDGHAVPLERIPFLRNRNTL